MSHNRRSSAVHEDCPIDVMYVGEKSGSTWRTKKNNDVNKERERKREGGERENTMNLCKALI